MIFDIVSPITVSVAFLGHSEPQTEAFAVGSVQKEKKKKNPLIQRYQMAEELPRRVSDALLGPRPITSLSRSSLLNGIGVGSELSAASLGPDL